MASRRPVVVLAALASLAAGCLGAEVRDPPVLTLLDAGGDYAYDPARLEVTPGATVRIVSAGTEPHTVTHSASPDGEFHELVEAGGTATFRAPTSPGEYPFFCVYHASADDAPGEGMAGVLVVVGA